MSSTFPSKIDTNQSLPPAVDSFTPVAASVFNELRQAIINIENALGVQPGGVSGSVANRFIVLETAVGNINNIQLNTKDLGGTPNLPLVIGIQGRPVSSVAPLAGQVLGWNGVAWLPANSSSSIIIFGGDLNGNNLSQTVVGIQGRPILATIPTTGQVLTFNGTDWLPQAPTGGAPSGAAGGDLAGTYPNPTVVKIQNNTVTSGALTKGQFFVATTTSNWAATTLSGDISESAVTAGQLTAVAINGTSVPATPTANQVLIASSGTAATWALIANANISTTAAIAVNKLAAGTSGQILQNNGTTTPTWTTVTGDVSITNAGATTVVALENNPLQSGILGSTQDGYVLTWHNASTQWQALPSSGGGTLSGDVTGPATSNTVVNITGTGGFIPFNATIIGEQSSSHPVSYGVLVLVLASDANHTLSSSELIDPIVRITSSVPLTATRNIVLPNTTGALYWVFNNTTGGQALTFIGSSGTGITVPNGSKAAIYFDGTNYVVASVMIGGDLSATSNIAQSVIALRGKSLDVSLASLGATQDGYSLTWVNASSDWQAKPAPSGSFAAGGDLTGSSSSQTVIALQGHPVTSGAVTEGQILFGTAVNTWGPTTVSGDITSSNSIAGKLTVVGIQGNTFTTGNPTKGQFVVATTTSNYGPVSLTGDITESAATPGLLTVVALQGNAVESQSLGSSQDGYVLTWHNTASQWQALAATGSGGPTKVQNGYNYGNVLNIYPFPGVNSTNSTTFVNGATFEFDPTLLTAANGTRTIKLRVIGETTGPQMTVQLYNFTAAAVVTGSTLTTSSGTPTTLTTGDLTSNLTNGLAVYQVQIEMASGLTTDRVTLDMAVLQIVWS